MKTEEVFEILKQNFADSIIEMKDEAPSDPFIVVKSNKLLDISLFLRDESNLKFDYLKSITGLDLGENLASVYHLYSMDFQHHLVLKTFVPKSDPRVPSVEQCWIAADWHERETYDLIGVYYEGHHNLIRILCPYDWEGHPLRKDYETPEYYHGMKFPY